MATNCLVSPTGVVFDAGVTPNDSITASITSNAASAEKVSPSARIDAVIVANPTDSPFATPFVSTVANRLSLLRQLTVSSFVTSNEVPSDK